MVNAQLELHHKTISVGGRILMQNVDFVLSSGERVALRGPNGCGKSTFLRELLRVGGLTCAYVPPEDETNLEMSAHDYVMLGRTPFLSAWHRPSVYDEEVVKRAITVMGMVSFMRTRVKTLSSGELRRLSVALALATEAPILLLDEPEAHLDKAGRALLFQVLAESGKSLVMALHSEDYPSNFFTREMILPYRSIKN